MNILNNGVVNIKKKSFIGKLFCKHVFITGENCSPLGLVCISGEHIITVCKDCGKVTRDTFKRY